VAPPARHDRGGPRRGGRGRDRRRRGVEPRQRAAPRLGERPPPQRAARSAASHTLLGAAPAVIHPAPERAAVIGLGSGDTAWASACRRPETRAVTVFEICAPQLGLLHRVAAEPDPPAKLERFLDDPRIEVRFADGRNALLRSAESYDLIEMDALFPSSPYAGNLYSVEFYELCARRLRPGGLMCTWGADAARARVVHHRIPHVLEARRRPRAGRQQPADRDRPPPPGRRGRRRRRWSATSAHPACRRSSSSCAVPGSRCADRQVRTTSNRDLFPRDELNSP
jgi:hypothetical protein